MLTNILNEKTIEEEILVSINMIYIINLISIDILFNLVKEIDKKYLKLSIKELLVLTTSKDKREEEAHRDTKVDF